MNSKAGRQYTLRNIPEYIDQILRQRARDSGKSFNQVAVEALIAGAGETRRPQRDFSPIFGSITAEEAAFLDAQIRAQRQIDPDLWE